MGVLEIKNYSKSYSDGKKAADGFRMRFEFECACDGAADSGNCGGV